MFIVIAEGTVTEQEYFSIFDDQSLVRVRCLENRTSLSPSQALRKVVSFLSKDGLRTTDEIWVVVDRDTWNEADLDALHAWSKTKKNYGFALTNPKFESWLLLHFEDAKGKALAQDCVVRLRKHHPNYDKHINPRLFTPARIADAINRARKHDTPPYDGWPHTTGSTVYRLVEKLLDH